MPPLSTDPPTDELAPVGSRRNRRFRQSDTEVGSVKISWRFLILAVIAPAAPLAQAVQPLDASLKSPSSFDEVLGMRTPTAVEQVTLLLEPTPADPAAP